MKTEKFIDIFTVYDEFSGSVGSDGPTDDDGYLVDPDTGDVQRLFLVTAGRNPEITVGTGGGFDMSASAGGLVDLLGRMYVRKHADIYVLDYQDIQALVSWKAQESGAAVPCLLAETIDPAWIVATAHKYPAENVAKTDVLFRVTSSIERKVPGPRRPRDRRNGKGHEVRSRPGEGRAGDEPGTEETGNSSAPGIRAAIGSETDGPATADEEARGDGVDVETV